jgi:osmotically-inducible protein OsmY
MNMNLSPQMLAVEQVADCVITERVKAAIVADPALRSAEISIETVQGEVHLNGYVGTSADIQKAAAIALNVAGVKSVKNGLKTK